LSEPASDDFLICFLSAELEIDADLSAQSAHLCHCGSVALQCGWCRVSVSWQSPALRRWNLAQDPPRRDGNRRWIWRTAATNKAIKLRQRWARVRSNNSCDILGDGKHCQKRTVRGVAVLLSVRLTDVNGVMVAMHRRCKPTQVFD